MSSHNYTGWIRKSHSEIEDEWIASRFDERVTANPLVFRSHLKRSYPPFSIRSIYQSRWTWFIILVSLLLCSFISTVIRMHWFTYEYTTWYHSRSGNETNHKMTIKWDDSWFSWIEATNHFSTSVLFSAVHEWILDNFRSSFAIELQFHYHHPRRVETRRKSI